MAGLKEILDLNRIDIWYHQLDEFTDENQAACLRLLSRPEQQRHDSISSHAARLQYLAGRGLVRTVLSRYHDIRPEMWRFVANRNDRPFIDPELGVAALHFNLSHTDGLVVCAIGSIEEIGVDVERRDRDICLDELAPVVLATAEMERFSKLSYMDRPEFFFAHWTLKEAYVKARGMGLSLPVKEVCVDFASGSPRISFTNPIDDDQWRWRLWSLRPTKEHIVGVAAAPAAGSPTVELRRLQAISRG